MREADLTGGPDRPGKGPPIARGEVMIPPASVDDDMKVALENYSRDWLFEVPASNWMPRPNGAIPEAQMVCVVLFDDDGDVWVPCWGTNG